MVEAAAVRGVVEGEAEMAGAEAIPLARLWLVSELMAFSYQYVLI